MLGVMGTLHEFPEPPEPETSGADVSFLAILCVLWIFSVARVSAAVLAHEVFGAEASLAFVCMLALPFGAARSWFRRRVERAAPPGRQTGAVIAFRRRG
jgi:hypothetical protein